MGSIDFFKEVVNYEEHTNIRLHFTFAKVQNLGPGIRYGIWVQGCKKHCKGCMAPEAQPIEAGSDRSCAEIIQEILDAKDITGITISGGEPLLQWQELFYILKKVKEVRQKIDILLYTGYSWKDEIFPFLNSEGLSLGKKFKDFFDILDYVIDGEYQDDKNDDKGLRGSSNQLLYGNILENGKKIWCKQIGTTGDERWQPFKSTLTRVITDLNHPMGNFQYVDRTIRWEQRQEVAYIIGIPGKEALKGINTLTSPPDMEKKSLSEDIQGNSLSENNTEDSAEKVQSGVEEVQKKAETADSTPGEEIWREHWLCNNISPISPLEDVQSSDSSTKKNAEDSAEKLRRQLGEAQKKIDELISEKTILRSKLNAAKDSLQQKDNDFNFCRKERDTLFQENKQLKRDSQSQQENYRNRETQYTALINKQVEDNHTLQAEVSKLQSVLEMNEKASETRQQEQQKLQNYRKKNVDNLKQLLNFCIHMNKIAQTQFDNTEKQLIAPDISATREKDLKDLSKVWESILIQIDAFIESWGFESISPKPGDIYDSKEHQVENPSDNAKGVIDKISAQGYRFEGNVIIKARVLVR